ncbi:hypothetical protein [Dolosigranulum pigrum]|nr:hypothetical protein [Dolosigranulum pigrum]
MFTNVDECVILELKLIKKERLVMQPVDITASEWEVMYKLIYCLQM